MAKVIFFFTLALVAVVALSAPAEEQEVHEIVPDFELDEQELVPQPRLPRATCDLFSAFGVADSACAAHCIVKRFRGGWCDKGVCHCRR